MTVHFFDLLMQPIKISPDGSEYHHFKHSLCFRLWNQKTSFVRTWHLDHFLMIFENGNNDKVMHSRILWTIYFPYNESLVNVVSWFCAKSGKLFNFYCSLLSDFYLALLEEVHRAYFWTEFSPAPWVMHSLPGVGATRGVISPCSRAAAAPIVGGEDENIRFNTSSTSLKLKPDWWTSLKSGIFSIFSCLTGQIFSYNMNTVISMVSTKQDWKWISVLTASMLGLAALEVD